MKNPSANFFFTIVNVVSTLFPMLYNLRLCCAYWKVFASFATATVRIRTSGIRKLLRPSADKDSDGNLSKYIYGIVLKETMLNLGPTFIKGMSILLTENLNFRVQT